MRNFPKIKPSQNGKITLSLTDIGKSCPTHKTLMSQICILTLLVKINFFTCEKIGNNSTNLTVSVFTPVKFNENLIFKAPIVTAADDKFGTSFPIFGKNKASRWFSWNIMPYLLFLKKQQNLQLSSAANYRWRFMGKWIKTCNICRVPFLTLSLLAATFVICW